MNIKITYNWLLEYLDTDATPDDIQKYISLCGPSVERVEKVGNDYVFDIEVTSNRVDSASVFGFAQECAAILPQFGKKASLKLNPLSTYSFNSLEKVDSSTSKPLTIDLTDDSLASRITGIVISNITIGESPQFIKERLEMCGIKSINNVVDISNYLMLSLGQPTHTFDYDKIAGHKLIIRESKKGETIKTLDETEITLPGGDIVIVDGSGVLTDLAGIMGGYDSMISDKTKNVLLFLETYNKAKLRRTSMLTGQRTIAATYFEKGLDDERIEPTLVYGVELLKKLAGGSVSSTIYDVYKKKKDVKKIKFDKKQIDNLTGIIFKNEEIIKILERLGFSTKNNTGEEFVISIPSYRYDDIETPEDIAEEVSRIYGYHNLPSIVQKTDVVYQPKEIEKTNKVELIIKQYLKHSGIHEAYNYSMISKKLIDTLELDVKTHLKLANTISTEIEYMRLSLLPSLIKNVADNYGKRNMLSFFEIANTYPKVNGQLPREEKKLGIASTSEYLDIKGIIEGLFHELLIDKSIVSFRPVHTNQLLDTTIQAEILISDKVIGIIGRLHQKYQRSFALQNPITLAELDFLKIVNASQTISKYIPINPYAVVKLDLTIEMSGGKTYADVEKAIRKTSSLVTDITLQTIYKNTITLRIYFSSMERNITEDEAKKELEKIKSIIAF